MAKYRFRTSIGYVELEFDPATLKEDRLVGHPAGVSSSTFDILSGKEFIDQLYKGCLSDIVRSADGSLWAIIDLEDGYYGSPEYLLEAVAPGGRH